MCVCVFLCFFFFQAEDGIRDRLVTGVQTCALPIYIDFVNNEKDLEEVIRYIRQPVSGTKFYNPATHL